MATVTSLTAAAMQAIRDATVVGAHITGDDLILELFDTTEINAGDVRGPQGDMGPAANVGDFKASIQTATHANWLLMGSSVAGADVAYPALWALAPSSWKSGSTLNLPTMADRTIQGGGTLGAVTGANTKVITAANLPPHAHTGPVHTHTMAHTHSIDHNHASFQTSGLDGGHDHLGYNVAYTAPSAGGTWFVRRAQDGAHNASAVGSSGSAHEHAIDIPAFTGTSGASSAANTGGASAANTGDGPGTSTALNVEQAALRLNFFIYAG